MTLELLQGRLDRGEQRWRLPRERSTSRGCSSWRYTLLAATMGLNIAACENGGDGGNNADSGTTGGSTTTDNGTLTGADTTDGNDQETSGSTGSTGSTDSSGSDSSDGSESSESGISECGDLNNDTTNCGFCGHDCGGAACVDGFCEPTVYENNEIAPQDLGLTDDHLFWADYSAALQRCEIGGCPGGPEIFSPQPRVASVGIFDDVIYFGSLETEELLSCPTSGCGGSPTVIASGLAAPFGPQVVGDNVYFINGTDVLSCPIAGCDGAPAVIASGTEPLAIQVIGDSLFFSDRTADEIRRCDFPTCEGGPTVAAPMQDGVLHLRSYGDHLYWGNQAGGEIRRCDAADCAATIETLATDQDGPTKLAVDDDGVYWANFGTPMGSVAGCTDHTCSEGPVQFANNQQGAIGIQLDANNIYWAAYGTGFDSGGVYSVPK